MTRPRDCLEGITLKDGWSIRNRLEKLQNQTGSNFSAGYVVVDPNGRKYFLKAIDFTDAISQPDPARALQDLTEAFNLERDLLEICKRLSCVVCSVADGSVIVDDANPFHVVQYLIFELAESDLRKIVISASRPPMSLSLRALHRVANGLRQLHRNHVAHQDTKPSNVLKFDGDEFKVSDLGRASVRGRAAPHDEYKCAGDPHYSPPELLYGHVDPEFTVRRFGCDAYMLGALATFLVTQTSMTAMILSRVHESAHPRNWTGTYSQVLPQIQRAFCDSLCEVKDSLPSNAPYKESLVQCIAQLCEPDPTRRGHPFTHSIQRHSGNVYDLERYVSTFDRLSRQASIFERMQALP